MCVCLRERPTTVKSAILKQPTTLDSFQISLARQQTHIHYTPIEPVSCGVCVVEVGFVPFPPLLK